MDVDFTMLAIISVLTTLSTECVKKLLNKNDVDYVSNIIAVIMAVIISVMLIVIRPIAMDGVAFTAELAYNGIAMAFFGALAATVEYDKLIQTLSKLKP